jgi:prepilin-type N-terminal cleavage/methylation domain-containing protein/prepilin-type processing-associated H-X9-DG protein
MKRRGFTLIELLVVIAIIAILAAILFPVITSAKEKGRQAQCCSNMKQLTLGMLEYVQDNNGITPFCYPAGTGHEPPDFQGVYSCPCYNPDVTKGGLFQYVRGTKVYKCPSDGRPGATISYSMNRYLGTIQGLSSTSIDPRKSIKLEPATAGRTTKIMLLIQEKSNNDSYCEWNDNADLPSDVHLEGTNLSYADGHVSYANHNQLVKASRVDNAWRPNEGYYQK